MPRRPRQSPRAPPHIPSARPDNLAPSTPLSKSTKSVTSKENDLDEVKVSSAQDSSSGRASVTDYSSNMIEDNEDDADAPRIAMWVDDDLEGGQSIYDQVKLGPSTLKSLQDDLTGIPLGALRKAQHLLHEATVDPEDLDDASDVLGSNSKINGDTKVKRSSWTNGNIARRSSKHAPTELTSKRPVTRKRTVIEEKPLEPRDPRFLPLAGVFSAEKFRQSYSFLIETHKTELATLQGNLKRARRLLASSPKELYEERKEEVKRLELTVKRAESQVNKDHQSEVEQETLKRLTEEERKKRKEGKGKWYLKESNKRELLLRARYEALAAKGGARAVKKAIVKRQKKIGHKEKKSRPYPKEASKHEVDSNRSDQRKVKRRRVGD